MRILIVFTCIVAGCTHDAVDRAGHTVVDSGGIRITESFAPEWGDAARIDPEPLLRIGREEEGPYQFGSLSHAGLLSDGSIVAADFSAAEVRIFDTAGRHVITLGRPGEGPGEFRSITSVFEHAGDSIAAYDQRLRRLTIFDRSTGGSRTVQIGNDQNLDAFGLLDGGTLLLYNPGQYRRSRPEGLQWDTSDIVAARLADGSARTITRLPARERLVGRDGQDRRLVPARYSIHGATTDGFWWATADRYEIAFYDTLGVRRRLIRLPVRPRTVDDAAIEAYRNAQYDWVRRFEGDAGVERARRSFDEGMSSEHVPLFDIAFVDGDQRLWVAESIWPEQTGIPRRWNVFDSNGVWLGQVDAPDRLRITDSRGDVVVGIWRDNHDVQHIQLHRRL